MAAPALERTIRQGLQNIANLAQQSRASLPPATAGKVSQEDVITRISYAIDMVDRGLGSCGAFKIRISDALKPNSSAETRRFLEDIRSSTQVAEDQFTDLRRQLMELMIKANPEDAWVWESENLAALKRAKAGIAEGHSTFYESGAAFEAAVAEIDTELEHRAHI